MGTIADLGTLIAALWTDWRTLALGDLRYAHGDFATLGILMFLGLVVGMLAVRLTLTERARQQRIALPAVFTALCPSSFAAVRHLPLLLAVAGLPWLALALAEPFSTLQQRQETFPGMRICLMIDASSSMVRPFSAPSLRATSGQSSQSSFFTTVRAAERFVELRTKGGYRDLMGLVEFGDQAYVITPFTTDYDNLRLSLSLIGDFSEFIRFPDQGTIVSSAIEQGVALFRAFDFLDARGNLLVLFSDGEDSSVIAKGIPVAQIVRAARDADVPIYFVRTRYGKEFGTLVSDTEWQTAIRQTGGRFYAVSDEASLLRAIADIDRLGAGRIELTQYVSQRPMFAPFAFIAAALWSLAAALAVTVPAFQRFP